MRNKTCTDSSQIPNVFIQKHQEKIIGVLHGFDQLRFSGTLRALYHVPVMRDYLYKCRILFKDFRGFALNTTDKINIRWESIPKPTVWICCLNGGNACTIISIFSIRSLA